MTYTYECKGCDMTFDAEQKISDAPLKRCLQCGSKRVRRLITSGNFVLKGEGWCRDGYTRTKQG
jgi:putative FmdB family regulatory protein